MNLKKLFIVIGALAALSAVVFIMQRPSEPATKDPRVGTPIVDLASLENTAKIQLFDQGKSVVLSKQADASWQVTSYYGFPADFSKLSQFVEELQNAKVDRFVTANAERMARFEFKDTRIVLLDNAGKQLWAVTLGKTAEGGGRLLRFDNDPKAYLSHLNAYVDTESKNWPDMTLLRFKPEDIAQLEISFPSSAPVVVKRAKKEDAFTAENIPSGSTLKAEKITALLNSLSSLRFSDTSATDDPNAVEAGKTQRTIKLTRFDGRTVTVALGRKPEQKIVKTPEAAKDGKQTGPSAILGNKSVADAMTPAKQTKEGLPSEAPAKEGPAKALEPITETIPAGPVYAVINDSDAKATINELMQKRAFQIFEYAFANLPQKPDELFQAAAPVAPVPVKAQ